MADETPWQPPYEPNGNWAYVQEKSDQFWKVAPEIQQPGPVHRPSAKQLKHFRKVAQEMEKQYG